MLVYDKTGSIFNWIISKLNNKELYKNDLTLGFIYDTNIVGGVIYSIENKICYLSIYSETPKWCTKENLSKIFIIPFEDLGCKIVKCLTSARNKKINKLMFGLRLRHEGHLRFARADGSHENVFSITEKELKKKRWFKCQVSQKN